MIGVYLDDYQGYAEVVDAHDPEEAVAVVLRACDAANEWEPGTAADELIVAAVLRGQPTVLA